MSKITKLKPVYHIQTNYGYGWDTECTEKTKEEAEKKLEFYKRKLQDFNKCFARIKMKYEPDEETN